MAWLKFDDEGRLRPSQQDMQLAMKFATVQATQDPSIRDGYTLVSEGGIVCYVPTSCVELVARLERV